MFKSVVSALAVVLLLPGAVEAQLRSVEQSIYGMD